MGSLNATQRGGVRANAADGSAAAGSDAGAGGDGMLALGYGVLFVLHVIWLMSGLLGTWAFGAWPQGGSDAPFYFIGWSQTTALLFPPLLAATVLRSAAGRGRLGGTTFKTLNLSLAASSCVVFLAEVLQAFAEGGIGFKMLVAAITAAVSVGALRRHGVPPLAKLKTSMLTPASDADPATLVPLARAYAALACASLLFAALFAVGAPWLSGALRLLTSDEVLLSHHFLTCAALLLVQAGMLQTLHGAAIAGAKRMASDTYRKLNLGACVSGAFAVLAYLWSIRLSSSPKLWFLLVPALALHGVQACVCYGGIRAGATK